MAIRIFEQTSEILLHINNIMSTPEDKYEDVWEVVSPRPLIATKTASDGVPGYQNHILSIPRDRFRYCSTHIIFRHKCKNDY